MKRVLGGLCMSVLLATSGFAAEPRQQVVNSDNKISIDVDRITLRRLLRLWDQATGLHSSIPPQLANRAATVHLSRLRLSEAVRKIFEKQELDFVFIEGQGIIVTAVSKATAATPVYEPALEVIAEESQPETREPRETPAPPKRPAVIQTPFGPIADSGNTFVHLPPIPGEVTPTPFFASPAPTPAGTGNGSQNDLFRPISIHQNPVFMPLKGRP